MAVAGPGLAEKISEEKEVSEGEVGELEEATSELATSYSEYLGEW